ncbi:MAG: hypothetical protein EBX56_07255, partial [Betaproteobacteria bacterium]|nr:hypothetical protein [Betaproteobacteria bacterium]
MHDARWGLGWELPPRSVTCTTMSMISADSLPDLIRHEIHKRSGWMGFDQYMDMALYAPGLGYYSGPRSPFGAEGDFVTAAAISPSYGACVARQIVQVLDAIG